jgi:hypothetical protein
MQKPNGYIWLLANLVYKRHIRCENEILGSFGMPNFLSLVCALLHKTLLRMVVLLLVNADSATTR